MLHVEEKYSIISIQKNLKSLKKWFNSLLGPHLLGILFIFPNTPGFIVEHLPLSFVIILKLMFELSQDIERTYVIFRVGFQSNRKNVLF